MKSKRLLTLMIIGVLSISALVGCGNEKNEAWNSKSVNQTMEENKGEEITEVKAGETEKQGGCRENVEGLMEEEVIKILEEGVEEYFKVKIDTEKLSMDLQSSCDDKGMITEWTGYWRDDKDTSIVYGGSIDAKTGKIIGLTAAEGNRDKKVNNISYKEIKDMSIKFIKENRLVENLENLKLVGEYVFGSNDKEKQLVFSYGEKDDEVIYITVDLINKKVCAFVGGTLDKANTKEITKYENSNESVNQESNNNSKVDEGNLTEEKAFEIAVKAAKDYFDFDADKNAAVLQGDRGQLDNYWIITVRNDKDLAEVRVAKDDKKPFLISYWPSGDFSEKPASEKECKESVEKFIKSTPLKDIKLNYLKSYYELKYDSPEKEYYVFQYLKEGKNAENPQNVVGIKIHTFTKNVIEITM